MKLTNIIEQKPLLESVQYGMTPDQRRIVEGIVREFMPLYEATLTKDQIDQLFGTIEKDPSSRTALGKGVDAAKKANEIINKIGRWMQDTAPVKAFDSKFEQLKAKISEKNPKLEKQLTSLGAWAKENPGKTAAVIGVLTALGAVVGGPAGGAIAGQVLRGATELLKGEKLSTAIGKGAKTAAIGYALGKLVDVGKEVVAGIGGEKITALRYSFEKTGQGMSYVNIDPDTKQAVGQVMFQNRIFNPGDTGYADAVKTLMKDVGEAQSRGISGVGADAFMSRMSDSVILQQRPLSEGQVYLVFQRLDEGPFDSVKKVAGKAAGAVGGAIARGAEKVGTALTQKNTAQGLAKAWTKAGSPTDSDELYKFLLAQKINKDALDKIYGDMKFPVPQGVEEPEAEPQDTQEPATAKTGSSATDGSQDDADDTMRKAASTPGAPDDFKQAAQAQQGGGNVVQMPRQVDLNKLAQDIKTQGRETVQKVKIQLTKDLKSA